MIIMFWLAACPGTAAESVHSGHRGKYRRDTGRQCVALVRQLAWQELAATRFGPGSLSQAVSMLSLQRARTGRFGLRHAVVVNTTPGDDTQTRDQIGQVTGDLLSEITTPGDVLGIGWARAVLAMAARMRDLTADRIVQLTGALTRPDVEASSVELVRSVGVGGWNPPSSTLHDALTPAERDLMRKSGVHADLSGVLLDAQGEAMETPNHRHHGRTASGSYSSRAPPSASDGPQAANLSRAGRSHSVVPTLSPGTATPQAPPVMPAPLTPSASFVPAQRGG
jgi:hypothetical protein